MLSEGSYETERSDPRPWDWEQSRGILLVEREVSKGGIHRKGGGDLVRGLHGNTLIYFIHHKKMKGGRFPAKL
jgi:hypothetical protein